MRFYKRYRGRKPGHIFRTVCRGLSGVGFLAVLISAMHSDAGAPLWICLIAAVVGAAMFAGFGYLGGLIK